MVISKLPERLKAYLSRHGAKGRLKPVPIVLVTFKFTKHYNVNQYGNGNALDSSNFCSQVHSEPVKPCQNYPICPFKNTKLEQNNH